MFMFNVRVRRTALAYSIISPIINGLAVGTFFLFYHLWKYLFLWQLDGGAQAGGSETGGLFFPKAIQHIFVGLYIQQICLAALFFLARDQNKEASAVPEGALTIVLLGLTAFFHVIITNSYGPLTEFLPLTLADMTHKSADDRKAIAHEIEDGEDAEEGRTSDVEKQQRDSSESEVRKRTGTSVEGEAEGEAESESVADKGKAVEPDADGEPSSPVSSRKSKSQDQERSVEIKPLRSSESASIVRGVDEEGGPKDFYHPASVEPQPTIWIPADELGLGDAEGRACRAAGLAASTRGAVMDGEGHVDISGPPPDKEERE